jgi:hypothetical protein
LLPKLLLSPSAAARQPSLQLPPVVVVLLLLLLLPKRSPLTTTATTLSISLIFEHPHDGCSAAAPSGAQPCFQLCIHLQLHFFAIFIFCPLDSFWNS